MESGGVTAAEGVTRVLVVDDSPVDRRVAQLLLSSSSCAGSFHVIAVDSAKKAMEFLGLNLKDGKEFSLAVTSQAPAGLQFTPTPHHTQRAWSWSLAVPPLKPIPVVVMSSEDEPQRISRCLNAGAEDFIVKPLQSKDVQRLRSCSTARPNKASPPCEAVTKRTPMPPPPSGHHAAASASGRRGHLAGVAMVLHSSSAELSQYFPLLLNLVLLVYAVLCLGEILHRWSSGGGRSLSL
ncbi:two-component response regulator ORR1-like [Panicum miliaceum]|uniref:Two-component response regulator ORR1-like n=1 Tax=Panicum miliaceum TaxID=4540 RepID=A0A3L6QAD1_PANMI|nr:two-component response regulator ORR1-like [Panicum miliaceum]